MTNQINKKCPSCGYPNSEIMGAVVIEEKDKRVSYNVYRCLSKAHRFAVKRKGNKKEQKLTEKYIKSKKIIFD